MDWWGWKRFEWSSMCSCSSMAYLCWTQKGEKISSTYFQLAVLASILPVEWVLLHHSFPDKGALSITHVLCLIYLEKKNLIHICYSGLVLRNIIMQSVCYMWLNICNMDFLCFFCSFHYCGQFFTLWHSWCVNLVIWRKILWCCLISGIFIWIVNQCQTSYSY